MNNKLNTAATILVALLTLVDVGHNLGIIPTYTPVPDVFDYIEMFYNPKRRHSSAMQLSPVEFEKRYFQSLESV